MMNSHRLSKEAKSQQQKFFRICSEHQKLQLTRKETMTTTSLKKILMILWNLGFEDYYAYIILSFPKVIQEMQALDIWVEDTNESYIEDLFEDECDIILKEFFEGIKSKRLQRQYEDLLLHS